MKWSSCMWMNQEVSVYFCFIYRNHIGLQLTFPVVETITSHCCIDILFIVGTFLLVNHWHLLRSTKSGTLISCKKKLICATLLSSLFLFFNCSVFLFFSDEGFGTIYVSDDRGTVYSKSLERHLYTTPGGETDFTNITSLRGVFTTSVLNEGMTSSYTRVIYTSSLCVF